MKLSQWLPAITTWLNAHVAIDNWYLDNPRVGETVGFLPPVRNVAYDILDDTSVRCSLTQDIYIRKRYPKDQTYKELPMDTLEGYYQTLALKLLVTGARIAPITTLEVVRQDSPITVQEIGDRTGDWLLDMVWSIRIAFDAEPEVGPLVPRFQFNEISIDLYREQLDEEGSVLDYRNLLKNGA